MHQEAQERASYQYRLVCRESVAVSRARLSGEHAVEAHWLRSANRTVAECDRSVVQCASAALTGGAEDIGLWGAFGSYVRCDVELVLSSG